jgi:hypothetical protein
MGVGQGKKKAPLPALNNANLVGMPMSHQTVI